MKNINQILFFENKRRIEELYVFRAYIVEYSEHSYYDHMVSDVIEDEISKKIRIKINRKIDYIHSIIVLSGVNPSITWTAPPVAGGYSRNIDLIQNIFNVHNFQMSLDSILDQIDRAIGKYEYNSRVALLRMMNPLTYIEIVLNYFVQLPFIFIGNIGFNQQKIESSFLGKIIKGILYLIPIIASTIAILESFDLFEIIKNIILSNKET